MQNKKSKNIVKYIHKTLDFHSLLQKCIAFSGDDCNTNFGGVKRAGTKNVFKALFDKINRNTIGIGCQAHILNNTVQQDCDSLPIDIESLILKIYIHFSIYIYTLLG